MKSRDVHVFSSGSNPQVITTAVTAENGSFCLYLSLGEYVIKVKFCCNLHNVGESMCQYPRNDFLSGKMKFYNAIIFTSLIFSD